MSRLQELIAEVEKLVGDDPAADGDDDLCAEVLDAERLADLIAVFGSRRLVELEVRKTTDVRWGMTTGQWLAHRGRLPLGVTRRKVRVARRLRSLLDLVDEAWADGRLTREHVLVLHDAANVRIADEVAQRVPELIRYAQVLSFERWKVLVRNLVGLLDQDGAFDPDRERERNRARFADNPDGDGTLTVTFDRATYASFKPLVEARADRLFRAEQREKELTPDLPTSSRATLLALAIDELVREGAAADPFTTERPVTDATIVFTQDAAPDHDDSTTPDASRAPDPAPGLAADDDGDGDGDGAEGGDGPSPAESVSASGHPGYVVDLGRGPTDADVLDGEDGWVRWNPLALRPDRLVWRAWTLDGLLLPASPTIAAMVCDAKVRGLVIDGEGRPLRLGRTVRYATSAQRIALGIRDGGCVFPGCDAPPSWCDAHHVIHVVRLGGTDIEVLALLCRRHHRITHRPGWSMHATDDQWFWWRTPSDDTMWSQRHGRQRAGPAPPASTLARLPSDPRRTDAPAPHVHGLELVDPISDLPRQPHRNLPRARAVWCEHAARDVTRRLHAEMLASDPSRGRGHTD